MYYILVHLFYNLDSTDFFVSGIMDGRFSRADLFGLVERDEAFKSARDSLKDVDCLIIDEASMLSAYLFEQVSV